MALNGILSIGYKVDGRLLALLTLLVRAMAVGFIVYAAIRIGRKVVVDKTTEALFFCSAVATIFSRQPLVFPIVLLLDGAGQVVVPIMQSELVDLRRYMTNQEFLAGYGQVQGLPGPMFSFAAYAGGIASRDLGVLSQILGAAIGGIGIFLPGILLIYFVYPIWAGLKGIRAVRRALTGVNAVAGGLIAVSMVVLSVSAGLSVLNLGVMVATPCPSVLHVLR